MWLSGPYYETHRMVLSFAVVALLVGVLLGVGVSWVWRHVNVSTIQVKP